MSSNSDTIYPKRVSHLTTWGLCPQDWLLLPLRHKSRPVEVLTDKIQVRVPMISSLSSIIFLEWLTGLWETFIYIYPFMIKDMLKDKNKQPDGKIHGAWLGRVRSTGASVHVELVCAVLLAYGWALAHHPVHLHVFSSLKAPQIHSSCVFMEASWC